jgi:uncharacterized protein (UPF0303 family)
VAQEQLVDADELSSVVRQEAELVCERFGPDEAFAIGSRIRAHALAAKAAIVIDIVLWDRPLFYAALEGSTGSNPQWTRRKINVVKVFHKSSYRMALEQRRPDRLFPAGYGLDPADYVLAGGGFPIRLQSAGVIGAIGVSGMTEREDHQIIVNALREHLAQDVQQAG